MRVQSTKVRAASRLQASTKDLFRSASRRINAAVIRTLTSSGEEGTTYLKNLKKGDTVRFLDDINVPGLSIDKDSLGTVVSVSIDGPTIHVRVDVHRTDALGARMLSEVVATRPDDVVLIVHSEDPRLA